MTSYIIVSPLRVAQTKTKDFLLNMNVYRNSHFRVLNNMKIKYKAVMHDEIKQLPKFNRITLVYTLFPKTKRLCDVSNVCCIVDKFFSDALVEAGKLEDDNYLFLNHITYVFGEVDKNNPRVEITIKEQE